MRKQKDRMDTIAVALKWLISITVFAVAAFFILTRLQHGSYFYTNGIPVDHDKSIVYDSFGQDSPRVVSYLGNPFKVEKVRENEELMYWDFDPVTLQIHFFKNKVSRMAYFNADSIVRESLTRRVIDLYGKESDWDELNQETKINKKASRTLVVEEEAVMVYGYVLK